ncbi:MAG: hypothetical protein IBX68_11410 [Dehalococcoidia bacterium]|nr:hypothetical protein [Dehalococcoidia bacterium]
MAMSSQTIDTISAILSIPVVNRILDGARDGKIGDREYEKIVDHYFKLRKIFEQVYFQKS